MIFISLISHPKIILFLLNTFIPQLPRQSIFQRIKWLEIILNTKWGDMIGYNLFRSWLAVATFRRGPDREPSSKIHLTARVLLLSLCVCGVHMCVGAWSHVHEHTWLCACKRMSLNSLIPWMCCTLFTEAASLSWWTKSLWLMLAWSAIFSRNSCLSHLLLFGFLGFTLLSSVLWGKHSIEQFVPRSLFYNKQSVMSSQLLKILWNFLIGIYMNIAQAFFLTLCK